jgi:hypothetical protein
LTTIILEKNKANMRNKTLQYIVFYLFAVMVLFFSGVMISKILPYLQFQYAYSFLGTKSDAILHKTHYQWAFYIHIVSSAFVIVAGIFQFSTQLFRWRPTWHKVLGKIYVAGILLFAAPSGMIIGVYANGGLSGKVGFVLQSITWWVLTYWAWDAIMQRKQLQHIQMMLRSYALTLAAMSLRTQSFLMFYFFETKPFETYQTVTWLSWVGNLLFVELLIYYGLPQRILRGII